MKAERFEEYHKHGCNFSGKLVVVDYFEDMQRDPRWGQFNSGVSYEYLKQARALVKERYGDVKILLDVPELVCRLEA